MSELVEFLAARIAEREAEAQRIADAIARDPGAFASIVHDHPELAAGDCAGYLADYDPARVLADCEAKRRIVARIQMSQMLPVQISDYAAEAILRALALPHADHPDYRPEWAP